MKSGYNGDLLVFRLYSIQILHGFILNQTIDLFEQKPDSIFVNIFFSGDNKNKISICEEVQAVF